MTPELLNATGSAPDRRRARRNIEIYHELRPRLVEISSGSPTVAAGSSVWHNTAGRATVAVNMGSAMAGINPLMATVYVAVSPSVTSSGPVMVTCA